MIWRHHEGELLKLGLNWSYRRLTSEHVEFDIILMFRGPVNGYAIGWRLRDGDFNGGRVGYYSGRWCLSCRPAIGHTCDRHGGAAIRVERRLLG